MNGKQSKIEKFTNEKQNLDAILGIKINTNKEGSGFNNYEKRKAKIKTIKFVNVENDFEAVLNSKQNEKQKK